MCNLVTSLLLEKWEKVAGKTPRKCPLLTIY